jgi:hypothetical protein
MKKIDLLMTCNRSMISRIYPPLSAYNIASNDNKEFIPLPEDKLKPAGNQEPRS